MNKVEDAIDRAAVIVGDNRIVATTSITAAQVTVFIRQVLLALGGGLVTSGTISDDQLQTIVGGIIAIATIVYGQYKARKDKAEKIVLADAAPNNIGTVQGQVEAH